MPSAGAAVALSPLESFLRQRFRASREERHAGGSCRIVFQRPDASFECRRRSAHSFLEDRRVYRQAGVRTPADNARRDILGSRLWIHRLLRILLGVPDNRIRVLWIPSGPPAIRAIPQDIVRHPRFQAIHAPSGPWNVPEHADPHRSDANAHRDTSSGSHSSQPSFFHLEDLLRRLHESERPDTELCIVFESMSPFLAVHGFASLVNFLHRLPPCLSVLPFQADTLTHKQHSYIEDTSQALLWLRDGDMTLVRQGIRESDNVVRTSLPFHIQPDGQPTASTHVLIDEAVEEPHRDPTAPDQSVGPHPTNRVGPSSNGRSGQHSHTASNKATDRTSKKVTLRMEDDETDDVVHDQHSSYTHTHTHASRTTTVTPGKQESHTNRPRIFLQDDDPEFDDIDEEDPDDDLDL